ncbi:unnamed protein product [Rotaria sordida]|uniref:Uncharacterized protein n=1 Tax=Rotaria sordida TaxID=392033 RepID=A0A814JHG8_9BILA|nr:unnamed protein product [Rotaria sordida]
MIILFLLILIGTNPIDSDHFNGGTIRWTPENRNSTSSSIRITITQSYSWTYPTISCLTDVPTSTNWILYPSVSLTCIANCSTQGGYSSNPINILTDCTSYSTSLGVLTSQRSVNITLNEGTYFWIAYQGASWRALANAATSFLPGWSIVSLINLQRRPDGLINTPPVSQVASPQYVIFNRTATIKIPVTDVDVGDDIRCRWSSKNSAYGVDECDDVCTSASTISLANLSGCTLTFTATTSNVWYAIALQVEDFINTTSTNPMSSVAIQFLIYVLATPTCTQAPVILPLTSCLEIQVNVAMSFTLYAMNYCNRTKVIITDLISTVSITGLSASSLVNSTTNTSLVYVTFTWTPQITQIGSQQFCALAYTSESVQSNPYCVIFTVGTSQPCTTTTSTSTTSTITTSETSTTSTTETTTTSKTTSTTSETTTTSTTGTTTSSTTSETTKTSTTETTTTTSTTTSTTSVTTTSTTTTTTTTVTTTTETTITTTSVTTATETTTITPNSNQPNLLLIVGLPILGLLLVLSGICSFVYYRKWSTAAQRRRLNKIRKDLEQEIFTLPIEEEIRKIQSTERSKNYSSSNRLNTQKSSNTFLSSSLTKTKSTLIIDNKKINNDNIVNIKKSAKSSKEENESNKSYQQQDSNENISTVENQLRFQRSSTTVSTVKKSSKVSKIMENNESNKSSTFYYPKNEFVSTSLTKIHVVQLARNKVSASFETGVNTLFPNQNSSTEINRNVPGKTMNVRSKEAGHMSRTNTKVDNDMRKRASSFAGVTVSRVKTAHNIDKSFMKHSMNIIRPNSDNKETRNRVTVVSVKKQ